MKPAYTKNNYGVKSSSDKYRNIKGIHYICYNSDPGPTSIPFEKDVAEAKADGLKYKIINGEFYLEQKASVK